LDDEVRSSPTKVRTPATARPRTIGIPRRANAGRLIQRRTTTHPIPSRANTGTRPRCRDHGAAARLPPALIQTKTAQNDVLRDDYFDSLSTAGRILTAIAAVLLWPLLLFDFDITIQRS
jgi:hypothetical protein